MSNISNLGALCRALVTRWKPQIEVKRFRYASESKPYIWRYGFKDDFFPRGLLARPKDTHRVIQMPIYRPKDRWNTKRALFGQNDYIDILGNLY